MSEQVTFSSLGCQEYGICAADKRLDDLGGSLEMPAPELDGRVVTLNQTGYMSPGLNEYAQDFIDFAASTKRHVLDIGAAYGVITIEALKKGAKVIANDCEERHLLILRKRVPQEILPSLFLMNKLFPHHLNFPSESLGALIASRIFHFLRPEEMEIGLDKITKWLVPHGRLYIVCMSPYRNYLDNKSFAEDYEKKWRSGNPWPGEIVNMVDNYAPMFKGNIPEYMHAMDSRPLELALTKRGFKVIKTGLFDYEHTNKDGPMSPNSRGRNYCGLIAEKN